MTGGQTDLARLHIPIGAMGAVANLPRHPTPPGLFLARAADRPVLSWPQKRPTLTICQGHTRARAAVQLRV
jgi:hypothetical protein